MLDIRRTVVEEMVQHARSEQPNECCGLLVGTIQLVEHAVIARNLHASPTRYLIDPVDHVAAIRLARKRGLQVVGFYHSHPLGNVKPSVTDLKGASYRDCLYVILSPRWEKERNNNKDLAGYWLTMNGFEPVELSLVA
jgi:proteasome lid subunit RPN8/RPN11